MQALWMLAAAFSFSIMSVCIKLSSDTYSTAEIVLFRGIVGVLFVWILITVHGGTVRTRFLKEHVSRGMFGVTAMALWISGIAVLSVATSTTLNYMSSIWVAVILLFIAWRKGEKALDLRLVATILVSFIGVILLLRPSIHGDQVSAGLTVILSSMLSAAAYVQVRQLGLLGEPEYRVVFYFSVSGIVMGMAWSIVTGTIPFMHTMDMKAIFYLLLIGISATAGQLLLTRAYRLGNPLITANLQYSGIVFASIFSIMIWGNELDWLGWTGIAIIVASAITSTFLQQRASAKQSSQPSA